MHAAVRTTHATPGFAAALTVEAYKLRRSLAVVLAAVAPLLIAVFVFFNMLRMDEARPWATGLQTAAAIWAFFMLPMAVTALTALVAHAEHGPGTWDHLRALPRPRWHLYAAKALCVLGLVAAMSVLLAVLATLAVEAAGRLKPAIAATGTPDFAAYAVAFGGHGETVTRTEDFEPAFERAMNSGKPAIIEIQVDPQALTPIKTLDQIRAGS